MDRLDQLHGIGLAGRTLAHARAIGDEVDDQGDEGYDDQENDPHSLEESAGLPVTEDIGDNREQHISDQLGDRKEMIIQDMS